MKKPSKTAAELEASIKVEMEDICDWPTDMTISAQPDGTAKPVLKPDRVTLRAQRSWPGTALCPSSP
jgi:hypothetical protein